jgi:ribonuclease HI
MADVTIYTDGGCSPNPGNGGWAAILKQGERVKEIYGAEPDTTNNRMELLAAVRALEALKFPCTVTIYTDSQYLANGITQWVKSWIRNGWMRGKEKNEPVKNADLWKQLVELCKVHDVQWGWVKAHNGHPENERCDQLAGQALRSLKTTSLRRSAMVS